MTTIKIINDDGTDGPYISGFQPDTDEYGQGVVETTPIIEDALKFPSFKEAMDFYRQQSRRRPLRDDGRPNRPLTALTVCFEDEHTSVWTRKKQEPESDWDEGDE